MSNTIYESLLRTDILPETITTEQVKVIVSQQYSSFINQITNGTSTRGQSPGNVKNIWETIDLIGDSIEDYQNRTHDNNSRKVHISYEDPDTLAEFDTITLSLERRKPGQFGKGKMFDPSATTNVKPFLVEELDDPDNPGYMKAVLCYFHDNIIRITPWCLNNKEALQRMLWIEEIMQEYSWYFSTSGVSRLYYYGHGAPLQKVVNNNRIYGRPIEYYVQTQTIKTFLEKTLEVLYLRYSVRINENLIGRLSQ